ncbi:MAG: LEA type 2 family protein [Flavobacteriia bacterium]|nr:LEA type 2 family protein [Flavobacteriia bacterium]
MIIFLVSACFEYDDVEFKGLENFKMGKVEGQIIHFSMDVKLENPNNYAITVKPSHVDISVDEDVLGTAFLDKKVRITKKKENLYSIPLHVQLADGGFFKVMKLALKEKVNIRFKGKIKGSILGISKKINIDETKEFDTKQLKSLGK